jgi:hypothetical protein
MAGRGVALLAAAALLCSSAATAKDFGPGLGVCGVKRCAVIENRSALRAFSSFYYGDGRATAVPRPRVGAPAFEIRFQDGSAAGMVASTKLNRARV